MSDTELAAAEVNADEPQLSVRHLFSQLGKRELLDPIQASDGLAVLSEETDWTPPAIRFLVGAGAWMSCWSIIIGLACLGVLNEGLSAVVWGALLCAAAVFLHRNRTELFLEQFSLSAAMTGVVMFTIGFGNLNGLGMALALAACFAAAVLYVPFDHAAFRFMSVAHALMFLSSAVFADFGKEVLHVMILLETIGAGLIFTRLPQSIFRPLGYALAAAMLTTILLLLVTFRGGMSVWPAALVQVCAQLWLLNFAMSTGQKRVPFVLGFSAAAAGLLGLFSAPGILAAIGVTVLGHLERDFILRSLGLVFLPVYLVLFYFNLDTTLLVKSGILIASGAILWGARWYLRERVRAGLFESSAEDGVMLTENETAI